LVESTHANKISTVGLLDSMDNHDDKVYFSRMIAMIQVLENNMKQLHGRIPVPDRYRSHNNSLASISHI